MAESEADVQSPPREGTDRTVSTLWPAAALLILGAISLWLFDAPVHDAILRLSALHSAAAAVSLLAAGPGIVVALVIAAFGGRTVFVRVFSLILAESVAVNVLKHLVGRLRPYADGGPWAFHPLSLAGEYTSWPSGHAAAISVMAVAVTAFAPRFRHLAWAAVAAVMLSRLVLNMHWLSDVLSGAALGLAVGQLVLRAFASRSARG
ncbi:MAG TPA: phosphatase PAP2 family protein [Limnochordia bacterium]|nr:phosphatase PAP2 family protein [Limnochordia bacterium]